MMSLPVALMVHCLLQVVNRKERRRNSISTEYRGDYLNFTYNNLVNGLLQVRNILCV